MRFFLVLHVFLGNEEHLITAYGGASPQGEADIAFPFGEGGAKRRMRLPSPGGEGGPLAVDEVSVQHKSLSFHEEPSFLPLKEFL